MMDDDWDEEAFHWSEGPANSRVAGILGGFSIFNLAESYSELERFFRSDVPISREVRGVIADALARGAQPKPLRGEDDNRQGIRLKIEGPAGHFDGVRGWGVRKRRLEAAILYFERKNAGHTKCSTEKLIERDFGVANGREFLREGRRLYVEFEEWQESDSPKLRSIREWMSGDDLEAAMISIFTQDYDDLTRDFPDLD